MVKDPQVTSPEFHAAWRASIWKERPHSGQIASMLVVFLMPAGILLDLAVYPPLPDGRNPFFWKFLALRLIASAMGMILWLLHRSQFGHRHPQYLGIPIGLVPAGAIAVMIYLADGERSPYYAGLNLVLLAVSVVVHATNWESVVSVVAVLVMWLLAVLPGPPPSDEEKAMFINNLYFLVLTGVIVVTGNVYFNRLRFREFTLKFELDNNRRMLEENNQKLRELDQIKSRFFANISHELRTPLTLLLAPLETLLRRTGLDRDSRDLLTTMHSNGMRLLKLINDLLDLVRLESGRMEVKREPIELLAFVKGLASAAQQVADDKRLRLQIHVEPDLASVLLDRDKLEKILLNLLFNALKFTPSGGRVELTATKDDRTLVLTVTDTGMGIAEKNLPFIFDRFWQADGSARRKYQGVGIGLSLVKELVEIQGGQVAVQSQEGKGTVFTVRLPYEAAHAAPALEQSVEADSAASGEHVGTVTSEEWLANLYRRAELFPALAPVQDAMKPVETTRNGSLPTVLVADDEPDMLRFLKTQLSSVYRVLEAVDGQQAVEKASQFMPAVIVLDMMMPEKDGLQACREIREHTPTQGIPIILLTARADEETKLAALAAGASDFLAKPFSTTELHVRIKNLVDAHGYQRRLAKQNQVLESTIEQLKDTETQLVQSEKLASLGRMSAGIIHEINNPLNFATTGLFTLRKKGQSLSPEDRQEYDEVLRDVEDGIKRVKNIVSDLRMFTHPDTESRDQVDIGDVIKTALRFLSNEWKDEVRVEQQLCPQVAIWANENKLIHVVVNLLQNAVDALKGKTFAGDEKPTIWVQTVLEQNKSVLLIRDNGTGITAEHLDKIFDPFYTTKDVGQGMGLGLSICYRIVQEYEGRIVVRTEPGQFCEFRLEFPAKGTPAVAA